LQADPHPGEAQRPVVQHWLDLRRDHHCRRNDIYRHVVAPSALGEQRVAGDDARRRPQRAGKLALRAGQVQRVVKIVEQIGVVPSRIADPNWMQHLLIDDRIVAPRLTRQRAQGPELTLRRERGLGAQEPDLDAQPLERSLELIGTKPAARNAVVLADDKQH
jgi:hypothetical protein